MPFAALNVKCEDKKIDCAIHSKYYSNFTELSYSLANGISNELIKLHITRTCTNDFVCHKMVDIMHKDDCF